MTNHEFINRIRSLYNIDFYSLPELREQDWLEFRDNPPRYLINKADKIQANAIIREMEKRQPSKMTEEHSFVPLPIEHARLDGSYMILLTESGYRTTPWRAEIGHYDPEYRPLSPWQNHANDAFTDGGEAPTHFLPLPVGSPR